MSKFDWSSYLEIAKELPGLPCFPNHRDAVYRAAISRAYYAAHNAAKQMLESAAVAQSVPRGKSVHEFVIQAFARLPNKEAKIISDDLDQLKGWRVKADYHDDWRSPGNQYQSAMKCGSRILQRLTSLII
jgi:uncharacterized protein (UPF0332 family)